MMQFLSVGLIISLGLNLYMLYEFHSTKTEMEHINNLINTDEKGQTLMQRMQQSSDEIYLLENNLKEINAQFPDIRRSIADVEQAVQQSNATIQQVQALNQEQKQKLHAMCKQNNLKGCD